LGYISGDFFTNASGHPALHPHHPHHLEHFRKTAADQLVNSFFWREKHRSPKTGTDAMISKIFWRKSWRFLIKLLLFFEKRMIITLVFEKNGNFFAENWRKSQKYVIITSTPGIKRRARRFKNKQKCLERKKS
jgi:hypothetical protein